GPAYAPADDALREQEAGGDGVHEGADALAGVLDDDGPREDAEQDPAPDPETSLPDGDDAPPVLVIDLAPARRHVIGARPHDPEGDAPDGDAEDQVPVAALPCPADAGDDDAGRDR